MDIDVPVVLSQNITLVYAQLEEIYSFRNAEAVRRFLQTHPHLIEVILEAYPYLVKHFGPNPQVML